MANIVRTDPFDDFFRGFFVRPVDFGPQADAPAVKVDVKEAPEAYSVHAELPGMKKEDIHVHIDGTVVSISAERKQEKEIKEGERVLRTRATALILHKQAAHMPLSSTPQKSRSHSLTYAHVL